MTDERRVTSPNGELEFRIFTWQSAEGGLSRVAYRVLFRAKTVVETSFLGLNIRNQEPILGENAGFMASKTANSANFRGLIVEYMQNGSLGRRIDVEARAYNDRVEFRYIIPRSTMLDEILIDEEVTEFNLVGKAAVSEIPLSGFPRMTVQNGVCPARRATSPGRTPLVCPWRVIQAGGRRFRVAVLPTEIPGFGEVGRRLNPELSRIPAEIRAQLPDAQIAVSRLGPLF